MNTALTIEEVLESSIITEFYTRRKMLKFNLKDIIKYIETTNRIDIHNLKRYLNSYMNSNGIFNITSNEDLGIIYEKLGKRFDDKLEVVPYIMNHQESVNYKKYGRIDDYVS